MNLGAATELLATRRFGGVLYVHTYGDLSTPNDFYTEIKTNDPSLLVIDDRCLCIPNLEPFHQVGADVQLNSTGYAKIVDLGFGGYAILQEDVPYQRRTLVYCAEDLQAAERACKQSVLVRSQFVYHDSDWLQTEADLPEWTAYCLQVQAGLEVTQVQRQALNAIYATRLPVELQLPSAYQTWRFNIRLPHREDVLQAIFADGLFASAHYASLAGIMASRSCPVAEELAGHVINLFNDHHFSLAMAERVCGIILKNI
jgi:hypothetical protein